MLGLRWDINSGPLLRVVCVTQTPTPWHFLPFEKYVTQCHLFTPSENDAAPKAVTRDELSMRTGLREGPSKIPIARAEA